MGEPYLAGHAAARALKAAGVPHVAGVAGESYLPLLDGLRGEGIPFISVGHESGATFLSSAFARVAGRAAVVAVTRGPGASNALIGIHEAAQAGAPVVLVVGQLESGIRGRRALQEMEHAQLFASVAKATFEVSAPEQVAPSLLAALRRAELGRPGPVVVSVPADHFFGAVEREGPAALPERTPVPLLAPEAVARIAALVRAARRGLFVTGAAFAGGAHAQLLGRLAERTGFGVVGGHAFPDALDTSDPSWIACSTIRGPAVLKRALQDADVIVLLDHWLGDRVTQGYLPLAATIAAVSAAPEVGWDEYLGASVYAGDPVAAVAQLDEALGGAVEGADARRAWSAGVRVELARARDAILAESRTIGDGAVPFAELLEALDAQLPADVTLVSDAGSFNDWIVRYLPFCRGRRYLGTLSGSMGFGVPAAIGVQLARPEGRAVALVGDGGFLMTGLELATAVRLGLPLTVLLFRNRLWGSIAIHQDRSFPGRRFGVELPDVSFAGIARSLGASGVAVSDRSALGPALAEAFASAGPSLVEIATDPLRPSPSSFERATTATAD